jgi:hypothetical protein
VNLPKNGSREKGSMFPQKHLSLPPPNLTNSTKDFIEGAKTYDLGSWLYSDFAALPPPLAWALLRADQLAAKEYRLEKTEAFGQELQKVLDSMCKSDLVRSSGSFADMLTQIPKTSICLILQPHPPRPEDRDK